MKTIKQEYNINTDISEVWKAFVNPKYIEGWGGGPAMMTQKVGAHFRIWGGEIFGKNLEVVKNKRLKQEWYGGKWKHPSIVTFDFEESKKGVHITLLHENVPDDEAKKIEQGWKDFYMGPMKQYLENKDI